MKSPTQNNSWVKVYRKFLDWEWYDDINVCRLFLHLLLKANYKDKKWRGVIIKRGSFITSLGNLSKETGLSIQQVRSSLTKLKSTHEITKQSTSHYTVVTVKNYNEYQAINTPTNKQATNQQQLLKKDKKEKNIYMSNFDSFWDKYPKKVAKKKSMEIYQRIVTSKEKEDEILQGLDRYKNKWSKEKTDVKYIPNPTTWLNQARWEDDVLVSNERFNRNAREYERKMREIKEREKERYDNTYVEGDKGGLVRLSSYIKQFKS